MELIALLKDGCRGGKEGKEKCERQGLVLREAMKERRETREKGERNGRQKESQRQTDRLLFPLR